MSEITIECPHCDEEIVIEVDGDGPLCDYCDECGKPIYDQAYEIWMDAMVGRSEALVDWIKGEL